MTNQSFEAVPEDWQRALAVVAHPDDLEYGAASAIARWTDQGKEVVYVLVTSGEAGIDSMAPDECARIRRQEEIDSAAAVGVDSVEFLGHPDGLVEATLELRRDLAGAIRRHRPDVLIGLNFRENFAFGGFNHADHRATGWALLDAARDAANRWLFVGYGGDAHTARLALFANSPLANSYVDIAATVDRGVASLEAHRQYLDALPDGTTGKDVEPFIRGMAAGAGAQVGLDAAVLFERIDL
ncbi:MAG: PIG-L family deacetylase [Actinobacteria bacterium]|nr:PIG-L family deacetylase [Actinomycetota bacterium]